MRVERNVKAQEDVYVDIKGNDARAEGDGEELDARIGFDLISILIKGIADRLEHRLVAVEEFMEFGDQDLLCLILIEIFCHFYQGVFSGQSGQNGGLFSPVMSARETDSSSISFSDLPSFS